MPRAITVRTMSPPWLTSTTSASASSLRHSAIARVAQPAGDSAGDAVVGQHVHHAVLGDGPPRRCRRRRCACSTTPADRPRPRCAAAAARRRRGIASISARDHSASGRSSMISPSSLLAAEPRAVVALHHVCEKRRRQIEGVGAGRRPRHRRSTDRRSAASTARSAAAWW